MAAIYQRRQTWWIRFYHPVTGKLIRESLGTGDSARAELLRQRVELEAKLLEPRLTELKKQFPTTPSRCRQLVSAACAFKAFFESDEQAWSYYQTGI